MGHEQTFQDWVTSDGLVLDNRSAHHGGSLHIPKVVGLAERLADEEIKPEDPPGLVSQWIMRVVRDAWNLDIVVTDEAPEYIETSYEQVKSRLLEAMLEYPKPPMRYTVGTYQVDRLGESIYLRRWVEPVNLKEAMEHGTEHAVDLTPKVNIIPVYWVVSVIRNQIKLLLDENATQYEDNPDTVKLLEVGENEVDELIDFCLISALCDTFELDIDRPWFEPSTSMFTLANMLFDTVADDVNAYVAQFDNLRWKKLGTVLGEIPLEYTYFRRANSAYLIYPKDRT